MRADTARYKPWEAISRRHICEVGLHFLLVGGELCKNRVGKGRGREGGREGDWICGIITQLWRVWVLLT